MDCQTSQLGRARKDVGCIGVYYIFIEVYRSSGYITRPTRPWPIGAAHSKGRQKGQRNFNMYLSLQILTVSYEAKTLTYSSAANF